MSTTIRHCCDKPNVTSSSHDRHMTVKLLFGWDRFNKNDTITIPTEIAQGIVAMKWAVPVTPPASTSSRSVQQRLDALRQPLPYSTVAKSIEARLNALQTPPTSIPKPVSGSLAQLSALLNELEAKLIGAFIVKGYKNPVANLTGGK